MKKIKITVEDEVKRLSVLALKLMDELFEKHKAINTSLILLMAAHTAHAAMLRQGVKFPDELKVYDKLRATITKRMDAIQLQKDAEHLGANPADEKNPDTVLIPELMRLMNIVGVILKSVEDQNQFDVALATEIANYSAAGNVRHNGHSQPEALQRYAFIKRHLETLYPYVQVEMDKAFNQVKD